jgi:Na+/melibiose symporter-like transporter
VDAVTDPLVGIWSDGFVSERYGRRHPFMYAASLPLALCFFAVFNPPSGLSEPLLFLWLVVFACGTRFAMTLFVIPHQSLVAELTRDYDQRTKLQSGRTVFAWLFGLLNALLAYTVFLKATKAYPYDPKGFPAFALYGGVVMMIATLSSSFGTQGAAIAAQPEGRHLKRVRPSELFFEIRRALGSPNYRAAVVGGLLTAVGFGLMENMGNYMNLYFWGFKAQELAVFIVVIAVASIFVLVGSPRLAGRFGKGRVAMASAALAGCMTPTMVGLRVLGVLPPAGSKELLGILCGAVFFGYGAIMTGLVMVGSMIADVTDEHELAHGSRQEGLLFAAMTLIAKAASGLAPLLSGLVIKLSGFPDDARPDTVDPAVVRNMGIFVAVFLIGVGVLGVLAYSRYRLTRAGHSKILGELSARADREAAATP